MHLARRLLITLAVAVSLSLGARERADRTFGDCRSDGTEPFTRANPARDSVRTDRSTLPVTLESTPLRSCACAPYGDCCWLDGTFCLPDYAPCVCLALSGVPECTPAIGDCCSQNDSEGCEDGPCCLAVCAELPSCCEDVWGQDCATMAMQLCSHCGEDCGMDNLIGSYPPHCSIDARQPHELYDATYEFGWTELVLSFDCDPAPLGLGPADFFVEVEPPWQIPPSVSTVVTDSVSQTVTVILDDLIEPDYWTCIMHIHTCRQWCMGYLPGDVDQSLQTGVHDILALIACINELGPQCPLWLADTDRSGVVDGQDLNRLNDLLYGNGQFEVWLGQSLPPCPGTPVTCGTPGTGDCFEPNGTPFCDNAECCDTVCAVEPACCELAWDAGCVGLALQHCMPPEACCVPSGQCVEVPPEDCIPVGVPQGPGTACTQPEACCFPDYTCQLLDPLCCVDQGGTPEGPGSQCAGMEACCDAPGVCYMADAMCCLANAHAPQGAGTVCTAPEACCFPHGWCQMVDPLCCVDQGGEPRGPGTQCLGTAACCFPDGSCEYLDALCCENRGGTPYTGELCGDLQGCCIPDAGTCLAACVNTAELCCIGEFGGTPMGSGTACGTDSDADGIDDLCDVCSGVNDHDFCPGCNSAIPTVSEWGLVILTLLLLVAGKVYFGRCRSRAI